MSNFVDCTNIVFSRALGIWLSSNGTSWDIAQGYNTNISIIPLKEHIFRFGFDGTSYYLKRAIKNSMGYSPLLSSNRTVGGNEYACRASNEYYGPAYYAFDDDGYSNDHAWGAKNDSTISEQNPAWIEYYMPTPTVVKKIKLINEVSTPGSIKSFNIIASNDGVEYTKIFECPFQTEAIAGVFTYDIQNSNAYKYYRLVCTSSHSNNSVGIQKLSFISDSFVDDNIRDEDFETLWTLNDTRKAVILSPIMFLNSSLYSDSFSRYDSGFMYLKNVYFKADGQIQWRAYDTRNI